MSRFLFFIALSFAFHLSFGFFLLNSSKDLKSIPFTPNHPAGYQVEDIKPKKENLVDTKDVVETPVKNQAKKEAKKEVKTADIVEIEEPEVEKKVEKQVVEKVKKTKVENKKNFKPTIKANIAEGKIDDEIEDATDNAPDNAPDDVDTEDLVDIEDIEEDMEENIKEDIKEDIKEITKIKKTDKKNKVEADIKPNPVQSSNQALLKPPLALSSSKASGQLVRNYSELRQKEGNPTPSYPKQALEQNWQGDVELVYYVDSNGLVDKIRIDRSSGHSILDNSAIRTLSRYRYHTGQEGWVRHPVQFRLDQYQKIKEVSSLRTFDRIK